MNKLVLKLFLFFNFLQICIGEKIICDKSANIELVESEIIFFETPNFTISINETIKSGCKLHITGNLDSDDRKLIFVITNGHITGAQITDGAKVLTINDTKSDLIYFYTKNKFINFSFVSNQSKLWEGFQGFVRQENADAEFECPFLNKKVYHFTNESEILYLRSSYYEDFETYWPTKKKECAWRYSAREGYGFKIDILDISGKVLIISNRTRDFVYRRFPYYYNSNKITIAFTSAIINQVLQNDYFSARISTYSLDEKEIPESCIYRDYGSISTWETKFQGYLNNGNCQKIIPLKPNHQLYANVTVFDMEKNVDFLRYYLDEELLYPFEIESSRVYIIPAKNETRNLTFEFLSDQSVINKGFRIEFKSVECKCSEPEWTIPCKRGRNFSIIKNDDFLYCADLDCNFNVRKFKVFKR